MMFPLNVRSILTSAISDAAPLLCVRLSLYIRIWAFSLLLAPLYALAVRWSNGFSLLAVMRWIIGPEGSPVAKQQVPQAPENELVSCPSCFSFIPWGASMCRVCRCDVHCAAHDLKQEAPSGRHMGAGPL
jgi:hypothetical protein